MSAAARTRVTPTTARRLGWLVAVSLALHLPLTPLGALLGLAGLLLEPSRTISDTALQELEIPVEIDSPPAAGSGVAGVPVPPEIPSRDRQERDDDEDDGEDDETPRASARPPRPPRADAGAPRDAAADREDGSPAEGGATSVDAGHDAHPPDARPDSSPTPADGGEAEGGVASPRAGSARELGDPVALSGPAGRLADAQAPVRLLLYLDRVRSHPHGGRVGAMLGAAYQWRDFFEGSGLDPVRDLDRILLAGPQLRVSALVVAVVQHRVGEARIRHAIDAIVRRDPARARWLEGPVPAAEIWADRAPRVVTLPAPGLLVVGPPALRKQAAAARGRFPRGEEGVVLTAYVAEPWKAFQGIPFEIPASIGWVRMKVILDADGGATALLEARDADEGAAREHARDLERRLDALVQVRGVMALLAGGRTRLLERPRFAARGDRIHAEVRATPDQLSYLLGLVARVAKEIADERARHADRERGARGAPAPSSGAPRAGPSSSSGRSGPPPPAGSSAR